MQFDSSAEVHRPRRLRKNAIIRELVAETRFHKDMLIYPYFIEKGKILLPLLIPYLALTHFSPDTLVKDVEK